MKMLKSKITINDAPEFGERRKGKLYQSDVHEDNIVVLCITDKQEQKGRIKVVVLRDESNPLHAKSPGDIIQWAISRLVPFVGAIELSN